MACSNHRGVGLLDHGMKVFEVRICIGEENAIW